MNMQRILKVAVQIAALALAATSSPQAQKAGETPKVAKSAPAAERAAQLPKNGSSDATPAGAPVARLRDLVGNVLVSDEAGLSSAEGLVPLAEGSRVITTAESKAVVVYEDGCEVTLGPNQRLEIDRDLPCIGRIDLAQSIFMEPGALAAGAAGAAGGASAAVLGGTVPAAGVAAGTAGVASLATLVSARDERPVSPN
jgi:hypothetical protein